jgi:succinoglycan biosynthesis protein ExoA
MVLRSVEPDQRSSDLTLVVIPCLNEARFIERIVAKIAAEADRINLKIVVADAGSTDGSREIVQHLSGLNNRIVLMDDLGHNPAIGINDAVRRFGSKAKFLIRVDAYADCPSHHCEQLLNVQTRTHADSVVVSMYTVGDTCFERAAAAAQNSILGHGGSAHHSSARGSWVDHGHHALMRMDAFNAVGGYDESFSHDEDAELDARLKANGFHIYLTGETHVTCYPRSSAPGLFRQYFNIGQGRARNFIKHPKNTKPRHLVLMTVAPAVCMLVLSTFAGIFAVPAIAWALFCLGYGIVLGVRLSDPCAAASGIAAMAMQAGWSFGFFRALYLALTKRVRPHGLRDHPSANNDRIFR